MNLESVVVGVGELELGRWGGGRRGRKGGEGKPIHLSLQALAGATAAALQRRKRRRRRSVASAAHRHQTALEAKGERGTSEEKGSS